MDGVSIVICCYNSEKRIGKVLEFLGKQQVENTVKWEIVIVDNASTDNTAEIAKSCWVRTEIPINIIFEPEPGLSNARKAGLRESKFSIVSFIDDDNWVEELWIQKVYNHFLFNDEIGLLGGKGEAVIEGAKPLWFNNELSSYAVGPQANKSGKQNNSLYGAGLTIRKKVWEELISNGFTFILSGRKGKAITSGEDFELCLAVRLAGYSLYYDENLRFFHFIPQERLSWEYLIKLARSFGRTDPVIDLYNSVLKNFKGYDRLKRENRWMAVTYSVYNFMCYWPGYFKILFSDKEGKREFKLFERNKYRMYESFKIFPYFPQLVAEIKTRKWKQTELEELKPFKFYEQIPQGH